MEIWKRIAVAPDYAVSNFGRFKRLKAAKRTRPDRIRRAWLNPRGYAYITLRVNGVNKPFQAHRLVASAFLGPSGLQVNHKNGVHHDNRVENLEYVTASGNAYHALDVINTGPHGERHGMSKLVAADIAVIWKMKDAGCDQHTIASVVGCTPENVSFILRGKTWVRVSAQLGRLPAPNP